MHLPGQWAIKKIIKQFTKRVSTFINNKQLKIIRTTEANDKK